MVAIIEVNLLRKQTMKLENGHHITIADATDEQYHKFCKKAQNQGFDEGEYGTTDWRNWLQVGIYGGEIQHFDKAYSVECPHKLLTIEQALSEEEETMTKCRIIEIEEKPKFKPFKLEVLVESEDDLINLWYMMYTCNHRTGSKSSIDLDLWNMIDSKTAEFVLVETNE